MSSKLKWIFAIVVIFFCSCNDVEIIELDRKCENILTGSVVMDPIQIMEYNDTVSVYFQEDGFDVGVLLVTVYYDFTGNFPEKDSTYFLESMSLADVDKVANFFITYDPYDNYESETTYVQHSGEVYIEDFQYDFIDDYLTLVNFKGVIRNLILEKVKISGDIFQPTGECLYLQKVELDSQIFY